ncbi:hypothetical protein V8E55_004245 [Tylopilus felleus]
MLEAFPSVDPSPLPHASAPFTTLPPKNLPGSANVALGSTNTFDTHAQAAVPSPLTAAIYHGFGGSAVTPSAPEVPLATATPAVDHSNTVYTCRCMTGGSLCNASLVGTKQAVREHLKQDHDFLTAGKDRVTCLWAGCRKALQRESIPRHILTCHFRAKVHCDGCGLRLSRRDVRYPHARSCRARRQIVARLDSDASSASTR